MDKNTKCPHHPAADGLPVRNALQHLPPMFCLILDQTKHYKNYFIVLQRNLSLFEMNLQVHSSHLYDGTCGFVSD